MGPGLDGDQGLSRSRLWRRPRLQLSLLLAGPLGWLVIAYLGSLAVLFVGRVLAARHVLRADRPGLHPRQLPHAVENDVYRTIALRTVLIAAAVTVTDALLAFPIAFYMAKVATPRMRGAARRRGPDAAVVVATW